MFFIVVWFMVYAENVVFKIYRLSEYHISVKSGISPSLLMTLVIISKYKKLGFYVKYVGTYSFTI